MINKIVVSLEEIAHGAKASDEAKTQEALKAARTAVQESKAGLSAGTDGEKELASLLDQLDSELSVWQTKLPVILKEPLGRQGMARHVYYWVDQLKKVEG